MKILLITKTLNKGGAASGARNLITALRSAGAEVVALDAYAAQSGRPIGVLRKVERVYERLAHGAQTHCLRLGPPVFNLRALCRDLRPEVVQLCDTSGNTIGFDDLTDLPCPVVQRLSDFWPYHGARHYNENLPCRPSFADRVLRWSLFDGSGVPDFFVAPSYWLAERLERVPVRVIRNAVEPVPAVVARRRPRQKLRFGFISNPLHDPRKGLASIPRALGLLADVLGPVELHLFGKDSDACIIEVKNVDVIAHPPFARDSLMDVYGSFDILLCPSVLDNSPNVLTEALAHGLPVIAQSGTGMDSYVTPEFGALIDFHGDAMSDGVIAVEKLVSGYAEASAAALHYATKFLDPVEIGNNYISLYRELLAGRLPTSCDI